jgi:chemotaxis methyl-accepting protein methylase
LADLNGFLSRKIPNFSESSENFLESFVFKFTFPLRRSQKFREFKKRVLEAEDAAAAARAPAPCATASPLA